VPHVHDIGLSTWNKVSSHFVNWNPDQDASGPF
jgi:hypothetical protein